MPPPGSAPGITSPPGLPALTTTTSNSHKPSIKGAVAAGHRLTAESAAEILRAGGNAFDAAIGGFFTACVTEPVLASLGGGGFLLARDSAGQEQLFDFFTQTPRAKPRVHGIDFNRVTVDFGAARQDFHIGLGACATPGTVRGMFGIHRHLGSMPVAELVRPAVELARTGVAVNPYQSYLFEVVAPVCRTESAWPLFASPNRPGALAQPGDVFRNPGFADVLEALAREGEALFYEGEIAALIVEQCRQGGYLAREDLQAYKVCRRAPLEINYRDHRLIINPPPSAGGLLIGFGLELLKSIDLAGSGFGSAPHIRVLIETLLATSEARSRHLFDTSDKAVLDPELMAQYRRRVLTHTRASRGTTHISIIDAARNIASLTVSNGVGCGRLIAGTGFMLNNMLGEQDLNPGGFHRWRPNERMSSMMAPGILLADNGTVSALGSGGSNRIRTAILQVVCNMVDFRMDAATAVASPRVHIETDALHREPGYPAQTMRFMEKDFPGHRVFAQPNMFFGGVHLAQLNRHGALCAVGDLRRDGVGMVVD